MATGRERYQSILTQLAELQDQPDEHFDGPDATQLLRTMDDLADDLRAAVQTGT